MREAGGEALSCGLVLITRCYLRRRYGTRSCNLAETRIEDERREGRRAVKEGASGGGGEEIGTRAR